MAVPIPRQLLTNSYKGPHYTLQPDETSSTNGLILAPAESYINGGLNFTFLPASNSTPTNPTYTLQIVFEEHHSRFHISKPGIEYTTWLLDMWDTPSRDQVCLSEPDGTTSQIWHLEEQARIPEGAPGARYYKLWNDWTGPGMCLDTYANGSYGAHMSDRAGDTSGQYWMLSGLPPQQPQQQQYYGAPVQQQQQQQNYAAVGAAAGYAHGSQQHQQDDGSSSSSSDSSDDEGHGKKKKKHSKRDMATKAAKGYLAGRFAQKFA
ncbi:unnamed protein product [Cercospora beticola]|nr:unnamed protein product [Cercospora beticola]